MPTKQALRRRFLNMPYNQPMKTVEESIQFTLTILNEGADATLGRETFTDERGNHTFLWHIWKDEMRRTRIVMRTHLSGDAVPHVWGADFYFNRRGQLMQRPFNRMGENEEGEPQEFQVVASVNLEPHQRSMLLRKLQLKRLDILLTQHSIAHLPLAEH